MSDVAWHVISTYEVMDDPQYFKISRVLETRPYELLIAAIGLEFNVTDTTDENDDVAFVHALGRQGRSWVLGLSAVGPFALFARVDPTSQAWTSILIPDSADLDEREQRTMQKLKDAGLRLLSQEELEAAVPVTLPGEDSRATAYHALFVNSGVLPWETSQIAGSGMPTTRPGCLWGSRQGLRSRVRGCR
jgi:hypothetical protein